MSQYVLSVTPPTPDDQPGSEFRTNETQFNLTVSVDETYTLTVRGDDSCGNSRTGQPVDIAPRGMLYIRYIHVHVVVGINVNWYNCMPISGELYTKMNSTEVLNPQHVFIMSM